MSTTTKTPEQGSGPQGGTARSLPVAAIAGALVLVGLVGFALYRRAGTPPDGTGAPAAPEAAGTAAPAEAQGTTIAAQAPVRLSPEAAILVERYRCVCGCNDPLGVCTCQLARGSEEMKRAVEEIAARRLTPDEADREMVAKYGEAALLRNPAPPQTLPSHAAAPGR